LLVRNVALDRAALSRLPEYILGETYLCRMIYKYGKLHQLVKVKQRQRLTTHL